MLLPLRPCISCLVVTNFNLPRILGNDNTSRLNFVSLVPHLVFSKYQKSFSINLLKVSTQECPVKRIKEVLVEGIKLGNCFLLSMNFNYFK